MVIMLSTKVLSYSTPPIIFRSRQTNEIKDYRKIGIR